MRLGLLSPPKVPSWLPRQLQQDLPLQQPSQAAILASAAAEASKSMPTVAAAGTSGTDSLQSTRLLVTRVLANSALFATSEPAHLYQALLQAATSLACPDSQGLAEPLCPPDAFMMAASHLALPLLLMAVMQLTMLQSAWL